MKFPRSKRYKQLLQSESFKIKFYDLDSRMRLPGNLILLGQHFICKLYGWKEYYIGRFGLVTDLNFVSQWCLIGKGSTK